MNSLYIVMPAYNEAENIRSVVEKWYPIIQGKSEDSRLVIADSGSTDETHNILIALKESYSKLEILSDTQKQHGPKLLALYKYAIDNNIDWIFQTDSDGQTNPDEFESFWSEKGNYDVIIGNRVKRGDGISRYLVEKVVCTLLWLIFGVKIPDANAPFRLMKSDVVNKYIDRFKDDYNIPNIIFTMFYKYYNESLCFKEITFKPRQGGKNSINLKKIFKIGMKAIGDFRDFKKNL